MQDNHTVYQMKQTLSLTLASIVLAKQSLLSFSRLVVSRLEAEGRISNLQQNWE